MTSPKEQHLHYIKGIHLFGNRGSLAIKCLLLSKLDLSLINYG